MVDERIIDSTVYKLKSIAQKRLSNGDIEVSMSAASVAANILYTYNQYYVDEDLENLIEKYSELLQIPSDYIGNKDTVLFYDAFGLDLRGWAASFVKALSSCKFDVVYVTARSSEGKIPHIIHELKNNTVEYVDMDTHYAHMKELANIFNRYKPAYAFFYSTPYNVSGAATFRAHKGVVKRIQVDLTDHAFWVGRDSVDLFMECRNMGAGIAVFKRHIKESQIIKLDVAPYINNDIDPNPLPFNIEQEQYIFGGGALYKTLGDKEHKYYQIIDKLLEINKQVKFLYAGSGDSSQMEVLIKKYPERVFLIEERSDFYKLISNSVFLLNTYPFAGGLMTRYAALAGKIPLTLKHGEDQVFLENQDKLGIEYDDCDDLIEEGIKLISNPQYRKNKEEQLRNSVIDEDKFSRNIKILLATNRTEYSFDKIEDVNTDKFRAEYKDRFTKQKMASIICGRKYRKLFWYFPGQFISGAIQKLLRNGKEI